MNEGNLGTLETTCPLESYGMSSDAPPISHKRFDLQ
jgi:hypothetical protein